MMMPANFSALAENEMAYTVGGSGIATLGSNIWKIIGNSYISKTVEASLGHLFSGQYAFGDVTKGLVHTVTGGKAAEGAGKGTYNNTWGGGLMQIVGMAAAFDQLMNFDVVHYVGQAEGTDDYSDNKLALITVSGKLY